MIKTQTESEVRPLNTFREGSEVVFPGVALISYAKVVHVSDCGVTISGTFNDGTPLGSSYVVSGGSPAKPWKPSGSTQAGAQIAENDGVERSPTGRAKRGSFKGKVISAPPGKVKFTVSEVAEHSGVPYGYAMKWIDENCREVGKQEKAGKGKKPSLFSLN